MGDDPCLQTNVLIDGSMIRTDVWVVKGETDRMEEDEVRERGHKDVREDCSRWLMVREDDLVSS